MGKRILIAEDHKESRDSIVEFVRFYLPDFEISETTSGAETIKSILNDPPDVVALDLALDDDISGIAVIKRLWAEGLRNKPRIIIETALGFGPQARKRWLEELGDAGGLVHEIYQKPFKWGEFLTSVAQAAGLTPPDKIRQDFEHEQ
jgi:CheY-like chemotaxis protein